MDDTPVVLVGGGPSGLTLGLALAKHRIRSVILEKSPQIDHDPRGVYLNGDAVRILSDLGLLEQWPTIGHEPQTINFHRTSFDTKPFYVMDTSEDFLGQAVPNGILHVQPKLEKALADLIEQSEYCSLRRGCTVEGREVESENILVAFRDETGATQSIRCHWLVGADGKKGIVRKHFLEPTAGIKQVDTDYRYDGTWVAANLRINLPTPQSHPDLPFWTHSMDPEEVFDLYWPKDWHFCTPPGKPTACGRFGPYKERLWRHEFAEHGWNDSMDAMELLWEHLTPMITRDKDGSGTRFAQGPTMYPRDCIEVLRCRPFTFTHKVVNRWFHGRTVLIGDAAHVFPPFGGEGIASGMRDAHQLAWRIALVEKASLDNAATEQLLTAWATERRGGIKNAADFTKLNGTLCNEPESWGFWIFRNVEAALKSSPFASMLPNPRSITEAIGFRGLRNGFFLPEYGGGGKLAQIFVKSNNGSIRLSDQLLWHKDSLLTLLVLGSEHQHAAVEILRGSDLSSEIMSSDSITTIENNYSNQRESSRAGECFWPSALNDTKEHERPKSYNSAVYMNRLGNSKTAYAIVRPDFYVFALLQNAVQLRHALANLNEMVSGTISGSNITPHARL